MGKAKECPDLIDYGDMWSNTPEDMQPMTADSNVDVLITNPEELTQENCLQAQAALLINPNLIGDVYDCRAFGCHDKP